MKLRTIIASVVLSIVLLGGRAFAHNTIFGSTGLIFNPTAGVMPQGQFSLQASYFRETPTFPVTRVRGTTLSGATGIAPRLEFSLGGQDVEIRAGGMTVFDSKAVSAGLKYLWLEETDTAPAVAIGIQYDNLIKRETAYLAISRTLMTKKRCGEQNGDTWRAHVGARYDRADRTRTATGADENEITFFGGIEAAITPRVRLMGEFQSREDIAFFTPYSATLHVTLSENATLFGGLVRSGVGNDSGYIIGVTYGFGKSR